MLLLVGGMCILLSVRFAKVSMCSAFLVFLAIFLGAVIIVDAGATRVFVNPPSQMVGAIGDSFTANVSIADVFDLYGYRFKLYYNSTVMNGTQVIEGSFLKSGGQTSFWVTSFTDHYNLTHGVVSIVCFLMGNVSGIGGGGVLATIRFKSLAVGDSVPLHLVDVELSDSSLSPIFHEDFDGTVTVIPEFTSMVVFLTLVIASLFGILVGKRARAKDVSRP